MGGVDLVVAIWMHLPPSMRTWVHRRAVQVLRPGGTLILEETRRHIAEGPYHHGDSAVVRVLARRPIVEAQG